MYKIVKIKENVNDILLFNHFYKYNKSRLNTFQNISFIIIDKLHIIISRFVQHMEDQNTVYKNYLLYNIK